MQWQSKLLRLKLGNALGEALTYKTELTVLSSWRV